ncbi:hypothetical protein RJZ57_008590, partial [Blastomyces gilchristii]
MEVMSRVEPQRGLGAAGSVPLKMDEKMKIGRALDVPGQEAENLTSLSAPLDLV